MVIGFIESRFEQFASSAKIDVAERIESPLDGIAEPAIGRKFGILIAEDDFSAAGPTTYVPPAIGGQKTDLDTLPATSRRSRR